MECTCRTPARCLVCNTAVRVPLTNLESSAGGAILVDRFARVASTASREGLRRLIQGMCTCPGCGNQIVYEHGRLCIANALTEAGVPAAERQSILSKISFPES